MKVSLSSSPAQSRQLRQQLANPEETLSYELGKAVQELPPLYTRLLAGTISAVVFGAIAWAQFSEIDEVATAEGKLIPSTEVRPVRALTPGSVASILVKPGDTVKKDQILVNIDPGTTETSVASIQKDIQKIQENITRLEAENNGSAIASTPEQSQLLAARQQEVKNKQDAAIADANSKRATIDEAQARLSRFQENIVSARTTKENAFRSVESARKALDFAQISLENAQKKEKRLSVLNESRAVPHLEYLNAVEQVNSARNQVNSAENQITTASNQATEADNQITTLSREIEAQQARLDQAQQAFQSSQNISQGIAPQRQSETLSQLTLQRQELTKKKGELDLAKKQQQERETVKAPFDGTVFNQKVTQGPVQQGEELLSILPTNQDIIMEVKVTNRDIGFIYPGMKAKIKLATFSFQEFGIIEGEVLQVSADAVVEKNAQGQDMGPVFPCKVKLSKNTLMVKDRQVEFSPGMAGTAELVIRKKTILSFITEPITKRLSEATSVR
jgi:HlyD family secretion protein